MAESTALHAFQTNAASIRSLIRCADVYGLHALAAIREETPDLDLLRRLVVEDGVSTLAHSWQFYMKDEEYREFGRRGNLRAMYEHIVFASYVAIEAFLKAKFAEYFGHYFQGPDVDRFIALRKSISLRSLEEINKRFQRFIGVSIAQFDHPQVLTYDEAAWFRPNTCWEGLRQLEGCRNQLAHDGAMKSAELVVLVDAWSVYQFCHDYAVLFDCNYNAQIYQK